MIDIFERIPEDIRGGMEPWMGGEVQPSTAGQFSILGVRSQSPFGSVVRRLGFATNSGTSAGSLRWGAKALPSVTFQNLHSTDYRQGGSDIPLVASLLAVGANAAATQGTRLAGFAVQTTIQPLEMNLFLPFGWDLWIVKDGAVNTDMKGFFIGVDFTTERARDWFLAHTL